jgi:hypothetical protein
VAPVAEKVCEGLATVEVLLPEAGSPKFHELCQTIPSGSIRKLNWNVTASVIRCKRKIGNW